MRTDDATLQGLKGRDRGLLERIVRENAEPLYAGALALGVGEQEAEELVQDTFAAFLEALDRFEGRSTVRTYLFGILYRKAKERGRKRVREESTDPVDEVFRRRFDENGMWKTPPQGPDFAADAKEAGELIGECLEGLTETQRAAFHLREVERLSTEEIRKALGVSVTNLGVLLFRARAKLRECLEAKWGDPT